MAKGSANAGVWLNKWDRFLLKVLSWRIHTDVFDADRKEVEKFNSRHPNCFTNEGRELLDENKVRIKHMDLMDDLRTKLPVNEICSSDKGMTNAPKWITNVAKEFKKHPEYDTSNLGILVQASVMSMSRTSNNVEVNGVVQDFFRVVHALSPKTCAF